MTKKVSTLLLIDGNSLFHRAYHAIPPLTSRDGQVANAVFGFSNMLLKAIGEVKPDYVACAFDTKAPTFRHIEFEKYKAQRVAPPPDLYPQLPKVKKVLDAFGIRYFEKEGYEADDILATLASKAVASSTSVIASEAKQSKKKIATSPKSGTRNDKVDLVVILSSDRDVLQLVDGNVKVQAPGWNLKETSLYGVKEVKEKYGLEPHQMVDYKSLTGDTSDNVPGILGIGPKTAAILLQKYHTLENLFEHLGKIDEKLRLKLEDGREIALAAKRLVELDRNIDIEFRVESLEFRPDWTRVRREYEELGFKSIVAKIPGSSPFDKTQGKQLTVDPLKDLRASGSQKDNNKTDNQDQLELI